MKKTILFILIFCLSILWVSAQTDSLVKVDTSKYIKFFKVDNLDAAVVDANNYAVAGDTVLLAPACASFDMFPGFAARGEQFMQLVNAL